MEALPLTAWNQRIREPDRQFRVDRFRSPNRRGIDRRRIRHQRAERRRSFQPGRLRALAERWACLEAFGRKPEQVAPGLGPARNPDPTQTQAREPWEVPAWPPERVA